jgi:hypothetical protein
MANCSTHPSHGGGITLIQTKHPNLLLRPAKLSSKLLISDEELQGGCRMHITLAHAGEKAARAVRDLVGLPVAAYATVGSLLFEPQLVWPENDDGPTRHVLTDGTCPHIKLYGSEIRYRSAKAGRDIELARAVGGARVEVSDQHGSYYCRANEIHYRAAAKEVILLGNPSISASHAPHIDQFGLVRIDLSQCTAEYTTP